MKVEQKSKQFLRVLAILPTDNMIDRPSREMKGKASNGREWMMLFTLKISHVGLTVNQPNGRVKKINQMEE
jgi:hypothetical protein